MRTEFETATENAALGEAIIARIQSQGPIPFRDYMEATKAIVRETGHVTTVFGRKVHYPEINTKNAARRGFYERAAINAPIQDMTAPQKLPKIMPFAAVTKNAGSGAIIA